MAYIPTGQERVKKVEKTKIVTQFPITTGPIGYYFMAIFDRQRVADKSL